ncbi:MAG: thioesterase [Alphaproteobacteria bacterium]|nr:thioesterase [Alphaproteobacteria bacterium]MDE2011873.1 thioesterase [Alphaproteobacteria bacterium]
MIELARSSVQTWECDQMGHMNVQFYVEKSCDALAALGARVGLGPRALARQGLKLEPAEQHIRFLRELRPGAPYFVRGGAVKAEVRALTAYSELVMTGSDTVSASFRTTARLRDARDGAQVSFDDGARAMATHFAAAIPEHGAPRGLVLAPAREPALTLAEADAMKLAPTYQGVVRGSECDEQGEMLTRFFMARVSDAIPNLLILTSGHDRGGGSPIGGAALEYRFIYRRRPRAGEIICVRSGLKAVGGKTYVWAHWLFDWETGEALASAEAVAVAMDLSTRKAIALPDDFRARLDSLVIEGLTV